MKFLVFLLIALLLGGCQNSPIATQSPSQAEHAHDHSEHGEEDHSDDRDGHAGGEENSDHAEHGEEEEGFVVLEAAQKKELGLKTAPVVGASGQNTGLRPGRIEADPDSKVFLSSQVSGTLQQFFAQVGGQVRTGDLIALISSPEATSLQSEYHEAEVEAELASKELTNKLSLIKVGDEVQRPIETARLELAQAEAQRDATAAKLKSAVLKHERLKTLLKEGIASKQQVDESQAQRKALEAELKQAGTSVTIATLHLKRESRVVGSQLSVKAMTFPAEARLARATEKMKHAKERLRQLGADPHEHDGTIKVFSSIDGVVVERPLARGELVSPGKPIALIVDSSKVWVWVDLQRSDLGIIDRGDPIELSLVNNPSLRKKGFLDYIAPAVDEKTQTVKARVVLKDPGKNFRLGSFVNARVSNGERETVPAISQTAVQFVEGQTVVYVREKAGFKRTPVVLGSSVGDGLVAAEGLNIGTEVVVQGAEQLKSLDLSDKIGGHSH